MKCIIGLGNPGKEYQHTRHNVGDMMVRAYREAYEDISEWEESKFEGLLAKKGNILLFLPTKFMNLSGSAVSALVNYYKLNPKTDILVISDDIDMVFGKVRFRQSGSHGGQNGLRDIISKLGSDEFARIKVGIGRDEKYEVADWVLSKFTKSEITYLNMEVFPKVKDAITLWLLS